mgnify:CR=1 FL=1
MDFIISLFRKTYRRTSLALFTCKGTKTFSFLIHYTINTNSYRICFSLLTRFPSRFPTRVSWFADAFYTRTKTLRHCLSFTCFLRHSLYEMVWEYLLFPLGNYVYPVFLTVFNRMEQSPWISYSNQSRNAVVCGWNAFMVFPSTSNL